MNFRELMNIADQVSMSSKDQSTKVGCSFINYNTGFPAGYGYNGFLRGMKDDREDRNQRPEKYKWTEHSERNALYNVARETLEGQRILTLQIPNMEAARAIVSVGLKEVICLNQYDLLNTIKVKNENGWKDSPEIEFERVKNLFQESDVKFKIINPEKTLTEKDKKLYEHLNIIKQVAKVKSTGNVFDGCAIYRKNTTTPIANGFGVSEYFEMDALFDNEGKELLYDKSELELEAVKSAIFNHIKSKLENCCAVVTWCPCIRCSLSMMKVGIKEIYTRDLVLSDENDLRWLTSFTLTEKILPKMGIELHKMSIPKITKEEFDSKMLKEDMDLSRAVNFKIKR